MTSVTCDPVNRSSAASSSEDRTIKTWNLAKGHVAETVMYTSKCHRYVFSPEKALKRGARNSKPVREPLPAH